MRFFVGVFPPDNFKEALTSVSGRLRRLVKTASWTQAENYHLTVAFLGEVREENLSAVSERLRQISLNFSPFILRVHQIELWKNNGPGFVGVATFQKSPKFEKLAREVYLSLSELRELNDSDERAIAPHLALFRSQTLRLTEKLQRAFDGLGLGLRDFRLPVQRLNLVQSDLSLSGPEYQIFYQFPLATII